MAVTEQMIQTLEIVKEEEIAAPIAVVFETILEQMGPYNEVPEKGPMPMVLEAWPGGRWFRDLGNNTGHWWGSVQAIKPPALLEICGPLFMSFPTTSNLQYRLTEEDGVTRLRFVHRAMGLIPTDISEGVQHGWNHMLLKIRERASRGSRSAPRLDGTAKASPREFAPLRVEDHPAMTVAGVRGHFLTGGDPAIASQWTHFLPHMDEVPGRVGRSAFGVCWVGSDGGLDCMSAVEVTAETEVPLELIEEHIPATTYAVFAHTRHVLEIPKTMHKALEWIGREERRCARKKDFRR